MKKIALFLVFSLLISSISFAETAKGISGSINISQQTLNDTLKNLRMAREDYTKERGGAIAGAIISPIFALWNFNIARQAREQRYEGYEEIALFFSIAGTIFAINTVTSLLVDLPRTNKKLESVNKSIAEIEADLFSKP